MSSGDVRSALMHVADRLEREVLGPIGYVTDVFAELVADCDQLLQGSAHPDTATCRGNAELYFEMVTALEGVTKTMRDALRSVAGAL